MADRLFLWLLSLRLRGTFSVFSGNLFLGFFSLSFLLCGSFRVY